jgi:hypothetical protein
MCTFAYMRKIPHGFTVLNSTYVVKMVDNLAEQSGALGLWYGDDCEIEISRRGVDGKRIPAAHVWEVFWHEVCHALWDAVFPGCDHNDARVHADVDRAGRLLAQITWTFTYGRGEKEDA